MTLVGFVAGLAITLVSSEVFARGLTRLGARLGLSEGLIGLLAALGADSPELSSAVIAVVSGAGAVGVGVVVGSNLFNLAALLGLSAVIAGGVVIRRRPLFLDAVVGLLMIVDAGLMASGLIPPVSAALIALPIATLYVLILAVPRARLPRRFARVVPLSVTEVAYEPENDLRTSAGYSSTRLIVMCFGALIGVVAGSLLMVKEALGAQPWLHLSDAVLGSIVLAALTSLPNLWVALHFARTARGTAVFSAAMNSNTINLLGGLVVPAMFFGAAAAHGSLAAFTWLAGLTLVAVLAPLARSNLSRVAGAMIVVIYLVFAGLRIGGVNS